MLGHRTLSRSRDPGWNGHACDVPMSHDDWMGALASHVGRMRSAYPDDELSIMFDIHGTIVDTRHLVVYVLLLYDRHHGTDLFRGITASDVSDQRRLSMDLDSFALPEPLRRDVRVWYPACSGSEAVAASTVPTRGFSARIRSFQLNHGRMWLSTPGVRSRCAAHARLVECARGFALGRLRARTAVHEPNGVDDDVARRRVEDSTVAARRPSGRRGRRQRARHHQRDGRGGRDGRDPVPACRHDLRLEA